MVMYVEQEVTIGRVEQSDNSITVGYNNGSAFHVKIDLDHLSEKGVEKIFNAQGKQGFITSYIHSSNDSSIVQIDISGGETVFDLSGREGVIITPCLD